MKKIFGYISLILFMLVIFSCGKQEVKVTETTTVATTVAKETITSQETTLAKETNIVNETKKNKEINKAHFDNLTTTVTDYSNSDNWLWLEENPEKEVDLLYFYPTVCFDGNGEKIAPIDNKMKVSAQAIFSKQALLLAGFTNVYVPYYRQMYMKTLGTFKNNDELDYALRTSEARTDLYAALDYYFENYNNDKPFILAGHSQGSHMVKIIIEEYMAAHPEYYKNMIAAYALGFSFTKEDYEKYPHMKAATGEEDTGVVISWNTEGPNATKDSFVILPNSVSINPLNWKTDETPATVKENCGSIAMNDITNTPIMVGGEGDAKLDLKRGSLVCTTNKEYLPYKILGDKSLHGQDWTLYAENIRRNAIKRTANFLGHYPFVGKALNYADDENWLKLEKNPTQKVDMIYIYPTVITGRPGQIVTQIDNEHKVAVNSAYAMQASALEPFTNVFIPLYRQVPLTAAFTCPVNELYKELLHSNVTITDVYAALDYYFENYNNGRPFILTSHSQGSAIANIVLAEYMKKHPEYLKRMVCTYTLGYAFTEDYFKENPHLKFASGETDTGVIIGWNTEAPNAQHDSMLLSNLSKNLNINPLNWKTDDTYAGAELNKGSLVKEPIYETYNTILKGRADAQIDLKRGSLICTTIKDTIMPDLEFGGKSLHGEDWAAYYMNIQENAKKRIEAYFENNK